MQWFHPRIIRHCHMGGSITPEAIWDILTVSNQRHVAGSLEEVRRRLTYNNDVETGFSHFLSKFKLLDEFVWDEWAIMHACYNICENAIQSKIKTIDLSFSVDKYVRNNKWSYQTVISQIASHFAHFRYALEVGPFLSISYHADRNVQSAVGNLIDDPEIAKCIAGLDLVGDERNYDADFFGPIIEKWNKAGKVTRAHIAEMPELGCNLGKVLNRPSIQRPKRIAHGIYGTEDDFKLAADLGIIFDLALTSNIVTGAVNKIEEHPLPKMLKAGCLITINTDDPVQFNCTLDQEYDLAIQSGLINEIEAIKIQENATISLHR